MSEGEARATGPPPLSVEFRKQSRGIHSIADRLVKSRLIFLLADRTLYAKALSCFYLVHKQLDESLYRAITKSDDADLKAFGPLLKEAQRAKAFAADLEFYLGPGWESKVVHTPAVDEYCAHLQELESSAPLMLLAHAYTQHAALLAGGQSLSRLVAHSMDVPSGGPGTAVFSFPPRDRTGRGLRGDYVEALDVLGQELSPETRAAMLVEHTRAFRFNNAIVQQYPMGVVQPALGLVRYLFRTWWFPGMVLALVGLGVSRLLTGN